MFQGANGNEVVLELNVRLYNELCHFMDTNATIKQCIGILDRFLFQSVEILRAKELLNTYIDMYFLPFFRVMLRYIVVIGWCPYHIKKIKDKKSGLPILVPEVFPVDFLLCTMVVQKSKPDYKFQFYDEGGTKKRNDVKVFMFSDMTLLANENLIHSLLFGLLEEHRYLARIKQYTIQSESIRSNPPIFLRRDNTDNGISNLADRANGFNGGAQGGTRHTSSTVGFMPEKAVERTSGMSASMILEKSTTDMIDNIKFHQNEMKGLYMMHQNGLHNASMTFAPQWHNNLFICPPNMILAAPPHLAESRVDQLMIERNLTSQIYLTFGIPETLVGVVGGTSSSIRGSTNRSTNIRKEVNIMDVNNFESTLSKYQGFFQNCFVHVYEEIFKISIHKDLISFNPPPLYKQFIHTVTHGPLHVQENINKPNVTPPKTKRKKVNDDSTTNVKKR